MPCYDKVSGALHRVSDIYDNVGGTLRKVSDGYDVVSSTLRQYHRKFEVADIEYIEFRFESQSIPDGYERSYWLSFSSSLINTSGKYAQANTDDASGGNTTTPGERSSDYYGYIYVHLKTGECIRYDINHFDYLDDIITVKFTITIGNSGSGSWRVWYSNNFFGQNWDMSGETSNQSISRSFTAYTPFSSSWMVLGVGKTSGSTVYNQIRIDSITGGGIFVPFCFTNTI